MSPAKKLANKHKTRESLCVFPEHDWFLILFETGYMISETLVLLTDVLFSRNDELPN